LTAHDAEIDSGFDPNGAHAECDPNGGCVADWYVVQAIGSRLRLAFAKLSEPTETRPAFDCYLPRFVSGKRRLYKRGRPVFELHKPVMVDRVEILFPGYFFIAFDLADARWGDIVRTEGVTRLISRRTPTGWLPVRLPAGLVEDLQARGRPEDGVIDETKPLVDLHRKGQAGRVTAGAFESFDAVFDMQLADDRIAVLVTMFGRQVPIELAPYEFRVA
jgi:transcription antitermination factor NusG